MEERLFYNGLYRHSYSPDDWLHRVRLSIFLTASVCVGLPALVWAFRVLHRHRKSEGRTSVFATLLLQNDTLELILSLCTVAVLLQRDFCMEMDIMCPILISLWSASRICGVFLQQMVVLERILGLKHPFCSAHVFFPRCSIIVFSIVLLGVFLSEYFRIPKSPGWHPLYLFFNLVPLLLLLAVTVTLWIITFRKLPKHHSSNRTKNQEYTALAIATFTVVLYLISIVLAVLDIWGLWIMCFCLLSLRVITDPLLCVLLCRAKHSQTHTDLSTDQTAAQAEQSV